MARRGGWRRLGRTRFRYVNSRAREIADEDELERIEELAIPPAWTEVWISPNSAAKLQATGIDAAGRTQYLYHETYRAARERAKFERLLHFAASLSGLRARADRHLRLGPYEGDWACAIAVGLINKAWFRVGSERHSRRSRTHGVTTLTKRHVSVSGDEIEFCFRAKNRRLVRRSIKSAPFARGVRDLLALPNGSRLFRFERDGELVNLTAPLLNSYLGEHLGNAFTAKDFRTYVRKSGICECRFRSRGHREAGRHSPRRFRAGSQRPPADEGEAKRVLRSVMRKVGEELGNTPAVARDSYVSPAIIDHYRAGRTIEDFRPGNGAGPSRLTSDEKALLRLLRSG